MTLRPMFPFTHEKLDQGDARSQRAWVLGRALAICLVREQGHRTQGPTLRLVTLVLNNRVGIA